MASRSRCHPEPLVAKTKPDERDDGRIVLDQEDVLPAVVGLLATRPLGTYVAMARHLASPAHVTMRRIMAAWRPSVGGQPMIGEDAAPSAAPHPRRSTASPAPRVRLSPGQACPSRIVRPAP